ncbi:hypothetical protein QUA70_24205 [Microcoleus sp. LAD1_D5]|uniref:hypothetical protein n=1 Tax=Microcoleus sp. LAD1_D5 TaxID=2818813 RepID=UPI002FD3DD9A
MTDCKVVVKRIVSPDGKVIAEAKSVVEVSGDDRGEISQSVSVKVSSANSSSSNAKSSSSSSASSSSSSTSSTSSCSSMSSI